MLADFQITGRGCLADLGLNTGRGYSQISGHGTRRLADLAYGTRIAVVVSFVLSKDLAFVREARWLIGPSSRAVTMSPIPADHVDDPERGDPSNRPLIGRMWIRLSLRNEEPRLSVALKNRQCREYWLTTARLRGSRWTVTTLSQVRDASPSAIVQFRRDWLLMRDTEGELPFRARDVIAPRALFHCDGS
jgi:hypothetical protein